MASPPVESGEASGHQGGESSSLLKGSQVALGAQVEGGLRLLRPPPEATDAEEGTELDRLHALCNIVVEEPRLTTPERCAGDRAIPSLELRRRGDALSSELRLASAEVLGGLGEAELGHGSGGTGVVDVVAKHLDTGGPGDGDDICVRAGEPRNGVANDGLRGHEAELVLLESHRELVQPRVEVGEHDTELAQTLREEVDVVRPREPGPASAVHHEAELLTCPHLNEWFHREVQQNAPFRRCGSAALSASSV
eukprot:8542010-Alexandrium_andersonii.AAC.1